MSTQAPGQSLLDKAKAEANEHYQTILRDLNNLRTAPLNEFGNRIDSLQQSVRLSRDSSGHGIEKALIIYNARIHDIENSLQIVQGRLEEEVDRTASLAKQISAISSERDDANANYHEVKAENDKAQSELKRISPIFEEAAVALKEAHRCVTYAQSKIEGGEQANIDPQKGSAAVEQARKDLSNKPAAERKHEADIQAEVETVRQRDSPMETEPNALQLSLSRINNPMTDVTSSSTQQSTASQPTSTPATFITRQDGSKETAGGIDMEGDQKHPKSLVSQQAHSQHMAERDRLFCEQVLHDVRHNALTENDVQYFVASSGLAQPINLTIIADKLKEGVYMSVDSFRKDFHSMVELYRIRIHPSSMLGKASDRLKMVLEKNWLAFQGTGSMHQLSTTQDRVAGHSNSRGHKRKASTERPVTSEDTAKPRRVPSPSHLPKASTQPTYLATGENPNPALPQPEMPRLSSGHLTETGSDVCEVKVTTTSHFGLTPPVGFHVAASLASVVKSPATFKGPWTDLIPSELCVHARRKPPAVDDWFGELDFDLSNDMLILRLVPSSESEKIEFHRLRRDLVDRGRYAQVNHGSVGRGNGGHVVSLHLIPESTSRFYLDCLFGLNHELLPPPGSQKALFLVVGFRVQWPDQKQLKRAWGQVFDALRTAEHTKTIVEARDRIVQHTLPVQRQNWQRISVAKDYMTLLDGLPFAQSESNLTPGTGEFLSLSYSRHGEIGGIKLPSCVFVLGGMMSATKLSGLVVVDLRHEDRPIWGISKGIDGSTLGDSVRLLRSKMPRSTDDWLWIFISWNAIRAGSLMLAEDLGLKVERCGRSG